MNVINNEINNVIIKEKITLKIKMITTMEDFINGFKKIWFYTGNDEGNRK